MKSLPHWLKLPFFNKENQPCYIQRRGYQDYVVWLRSHTRLYEVAVVESRQMANDIVKTLENLDLEERDRVIKKSISGKYFTAANNLLGVKRT